MERYRHLEKIGKGAYGVVYKSLDLTTNKFVAFKKIRLEVEDEGIPSTTLREISYLRMLQFIRHPNIVFLENIIIEGNRLHLIFELVDGDLKKVIEASESGLEPALVRQYTSQIFDGLAYMHAMGIMHRDLKPQNLLVGNTGIKIADFGLARSFSAHNRPLSVEVVTRYYRPPEILLGSCEYTAAVDVWSVGCIIAEMSNHCILFHADSEIDLIHRIFRRLGTPTMDEWPEFPALPYARNDYPQWPHRTSFAIDLPNLCSDGIDLLDQIFQYDASKRIPAVSALRHAFCYKAQSPTRIPATPVSPSMTPSRPTPVPLTDLTPREEAGEEKTDISLPHPSSLPSSQTSFDQESAGKASNLSMDPNPITELPMRRRSPRGNPSPPASSTAAIEEPEPPQPLKRHRRKK